MPCGPYGSPFLKATKESAEIRLRWWRGLVGRQGVVMGRAKRTVVKNSWAVIHGWMAQHAPGLLKRLHGPADEATLSRLQTQLGVELREDFLASSRIHNGAYRIPGPIVGIPLLTAAGIVREWKFVRPRRGEERPPPKGSVSATPGAVREVGWTAGWVPFAGPDEGNYLALDFDPGPEGAAGQVITFGEDQLKYGTKRYVLAGSFGGFMGLLAGLFAGGGVEREDDSDDYLRLTRRRGGGA